MSLLNKMRADLNTLWVLRFECLDTAQNAKCDVEKRRLRALAEKLRLEYFNKKALYDKQREFNKGVKNEIEY